MDTTQSPRGRLAPAVLILALAAPAPRAQHGEGVRSFERVRLGETFYAEGANFGDLDGDGRADLVAGPYWYRGPSFAERFEIYEPKPFDPAHYSDNFFAWVHDFDGDGWNDVLVVGFPGQDASWYENPRVAGTRWARHRVFDVVDNESPAFVDLTGDGRPELVCQNGDRLGWAGPDGDDPRAPWTFHALSPTGYGGRFTHGLGVGDVDGDGRNDVLWRHGWFAQPESLAGDPQWRYHPYAFARRGGAQMLVYDVDGDGDNDVVSSIDAHGFGLAWFEHVVRDGAITFERHRILADDPRDETIGVVVGNLHALALADMDGDGLRDVVTGSRYWAHSGNDPADRLPPYLYWFRLVREHAADGAPRARFVPQRIDDDTGVGTQVVAGDVDGDGRIDVVVGNKKGTTLLRQVAAAAPATGQGTRQAATGAVASAQDAEGVVPKAADGRALNLGFESGDLRDWTATGDAFAGLPVRGDTVFPRRDDMHSGHAGEWWVGTYEPKRSDGTRGTLTSAPFRVTHPYASCLVGGGQWSETRVEIVRADSGTVVRRLVGRDREDMRRRYVDLRAHVGHEIFVRVVDDRDGHWGHVNYDDFRFHAALPAGASATEVTSNEQPEGNAPDVAARQMTVPEGFRVDLIAGEPDLHQPIAFTFDDKGRIWVAEAFAYPVRKPDGEGDDRIVVFADRDADGTFETRTEFTRGLNLVSGLEVGFGGVWVGAAPYLLFIPDRDGDLVPDSEPQVLLDGFGYQDTHETLNAFHWGPDGWLYGCHGVFTHSRVGKPGTPDAQRTPMNAAVWRYHPTRHEFEVFAWGASNQWGVDFDDHGQAFITACVIPHLYHVIQGGRYVRQAGRHFDPFVYDDIDTIADHLHWVGASPHDGNEVSGSVGGGHAHCGAMIYLGGAFPSEYRGRLLMNNIHGNRVNVDLLEPQGSGFVGRHGPDFLLANDAWFRGIALRYGPDGNVYLIDWYDKQACHRTTPEIWDRTNGRMYRVAWRDAGPVNVDLAALSSRELVELHARDNDWFVRTARRVLQERGPDAEVHRLLLASVLATDAAPARRLRALWTLHATGGLDEPLALRLLGDSAEHLRAWAIQLALEQRRATPALLARLTGLAATEPSPVVRKYLASALQRLPLAARWGIAAGLLARGEDEGDHNLPLLYWYGVEPLVAAEPARAAELWRACRIPQVRRFVVRRLAAGRDAHVEAAVALLSATDGVDAQREILNEIATAFGARADVAMPRAWPALFARLAGSADAVVRDRALELANAFGDPGAVPHLRARVSDTAVAAERRLAALDSLVRKKDAGLPDVLLGLLDDGALAERAVRALATFDDARTPQVLLARASTAKAAMRAEIVRTMASRAGWARTLLEAVAGGSLPRTLLDDAGTRRQIAGFGDAGLDALVERAWGRSVAVAGDKRAEIESLKQKLGDAAMAAADRCRGRALFARTCMACHELFGVGGDLGPGITGSNRADLDYLLTNIVDPSAEVPRQFMMTSVKLADGRYVSGAIQAQDDSSITLRNQTTTEVVALRDVARDAAGRHVIETSPISVMPIGQHLSMSDDELRDLVAYLRGGEQVPLRATKDDVERFFDGTTLSMWDADPAVWRVEDGAIVGRSEQGLAENSFARSHLLLGDFRLVCEVRLLPDSANSGIQFRSEEIAGGQMRGYQADIGAGWWGRLYEEHGRALLSEQAADAHVRPGEWNTYEILAVGHRVQTAINGVRCVDLVDEDGATSGIVGLQVHSGGPTEVRFRGFRLELDPAPRLSTVR